VTGRVVRHRLSSRVLKGNPLRDPTERELPVYLPPGYSPGKAYPALMALAGFTGSGPMFFNRNPLAEGLDQRLDRLISSGKCPPVIVAAPDCFTKLGGNQYINSSATGRYEDYLIREVVPFVARTYRVSRWGVFGKSSGGYGAIVQAMRHPEIFQVAADHSGDSDFELCYIQDFSDAFDRFREAGGPAKWLSSFWKDPNHSRRKQARPLNILAMAAHYSPNPRSKTLGIDFPFDLQTGVFRPEVWKRWQAWDPVRMVPRHVAALKKIRAIYVDCGDQDEFSLHWGARALSAALRKHRIRHVYETFPDGHMNIPYRFDRSLPLLAKALS